MSRVWSEASGGSDFGDSSSSSPLKKPKTDPEPEIPILRRGNWDDPEYKKQRLMFEEQIKKSEGYDVDWSNVTYNLPVLKFEWAASLSGLISNKDLLDLLIETAIELENEETGSNLEFVKYVSANVEGVKGFLFYITLWARDLNSPNQEPKLYQTKVRKFADEISVRDFRLRPTQDLLF
ncbi:hypothetical protein AALP_AAs44563U000200 [Arabis alpina]|uniref:Cystatin domain-containing protein n=1 Tax=Arabis alpina TaxID=50452 RepID=A0A087FXI7_ARAAL|nr:hypothetical protein AALP_AAs44563U000200 [Arabis alpina]